MTPEAAKGLFDILSYAKDIGFSGSLIIFIYGMFKGWWILGPTYKARLTELESDRDWWRGRVMDSMAINRSTVAVTQKVASAIVDERG